MDSIFEKGEKIDSLEVQFFLGTSGLSEMYRVRDGEGNLFRLELLDLAGLPSTFYGADRKPDSWQFQNDFELHGLQKPLKWGEFRKDGRELGYFLFDFISSDSLFDLMKREAMVPAFRVVPVIADLLKLLGALHSKPEQIIHNSLNLYSVRLDHARQGGKVLLTCFDQARRIEDVGSKPVQQRALNALFSAPELLKGRWSPSSDIFSVGALFHHLVLGVPPWAAKLSSAGEGEIDRGELDNARRQPLRFDLIAEGVLDEHLRKVLRKALAYDPSDRFADVGEFESALKRKVELADMPQASKKATASKANPAKEGRSGFAAIAGMAVLKELLQREVVDPLWEPELYESYGVPLLNGLLLYGPPGCGKTFMAERLAEEVGFNFINVRPSDLASPYVHGGQEKIGSLFSAARDAAPTLVFIDEIDAVIPSRDARDVQHHYASEVNEILTQMNNCGADRILVIGATNRPEMLDPAALRTGRFDRIILVPEPDKAAREELFRLELSKRPLKGVIDYDGLAEMTQGFVSSDIVAMVNQAARSALARKSPISSELLLEAARSFTPSVSEADIKKYRELEKKFGATRTGRTENQPKIGFTASRDPEQ